MHVMVHEFKLRNSLTIFQLTRFTFMWTFSKLKKKCNILIQFNFQLLSIMICVFCQERLFPENGEHVDLKSTTCGHVFHRSCLEDASKRYENLFVLDKAQIIFIGKNLNTEINKFGHIHSLNKSELLSAHCANKN